MIRLSVIDRFGERADPGPVLGDMRDAVADRVTGRPIGDLLAVDRHAAAARPQAGDDLGQLALAVAGDRGDPDDLAGGHVERDPAQGRQPAVVLGRHVADRKDRGAGPLRRALDGLEHVPPDHPPGQVGRRGLAREDAGGRHDAAAHDRDPVRDGEHLAELVADEHHAPAVGGHGVERPEQLVDLLRGEDRGRLVHDQDACPAVEELQDLDPLLLADGELPDLRSRVDAHAELVGEAGDLGLRATDVQPEPGLVEPEQDVLGDRLRGDQREVLMDHPEPGRDRVARRTEGDGRPVEQDLAGIRPVEPGQDVHQGALAGAVLAEQCVDLARAQVEVNLVVGDDAGKGLDDAARLERGHRRRRGGRHG